MASDEEDDADLEALRNAVLATMKSVPKSENSNSNASFNVGQNDTNWSAIRQEFVGPSQFEPQSYQPVPTELNFRHVFHQNQVFHHGRGRSRGNNWHPFRRGRNRRGGGGGWGGQDGGFSAPGRDTGRISNLIVINTVPMEEDSNASTCNNITDNDIRRNTDNRPLLIRPQDKWAPSADDTSASSTPTRRRVVNKFSRYENDSDSDDLSDEEIYEEVIEEIVDTFENGSEADEEIENSELAESEDIQSELAESIDNESELVESIENQSELVESGDNQSNAGNDDESIDDKILDESDEADDKQLDDLDEQSEMQNETAEIQESEEECEQVDDDYDAEIQDNEQVDDDNDAEIQDNEQVDDDNDAEIQDNEQVDDDNDAEIQDSEPVDDVNELEQQDIEQEIEQIDDANDSEQENDMNTSNVCKSNESSPKIQNTEANWSRVSSPDYTRHGRRRRSSDDSDSELDRKSVSSSSSSSSVSRSVSPAESEENISSSKSVSGSSSRKNSLDHSSKNASPSSCHSKSNSVRSRSSSRNASRSNSTNRSVDHDHSKNHLSNKNVSSSGSGQDFHAKKNRNDSPKMIKNKSRNRSFSPSLRKSGDRKDFRPTDGHIYTGKNEVLKSKRSSSSHRNRPRSYSPKDKAKDRTYQSTKSDKGHLKSYSKYGSDRDAKSYKTRRSRSRSYSPKFKSRNSDRGTGKSSRQHQSRALSSENYSKVGTLKGSDREKFHSDSQSVRIERDEKAEKLNQRECGAKHKNEIKTSKKITSVSNKDFQKLEERKRKFETDAEVNFKHDKKTISLKGIIPKGKSNTKQNVSEMGSENSAADIKNKRNYDSLKSNSDRIFGKQIERKQLAETRTKRSSLDKDSKRTTNSRSKVEDIESESSDSSSSMLSDSDSDSDEDIWRNKTAGKFERCIEDIERDRRKRSQEMKSKDVKHSNRGYERTKNRELVSDSLHDRNRFKRDDRTEYYNKHLYQEQRRPRFVEVEDDGGDESDAAGSRKLLTSVVLSGSGQRLSRYSDPADNSDSKFVKVRVNNKDTKQSKTKSPRERIIVAFNERNSEKRHSEEEISKSDDSNEDSSDESTPVRITFNSNSAYSDERKDSKSKSVSQKHKLSVHERLGLPVAKHQNVAEKRKYKDIKDIDSPPRTKFKRDSEFERRSRDRETGKKKSSHHKREKDKEGRRNTKDVDAKMKLMERKNAEIRKRQFEVSVDKKRYG